MKVRVSEIKVKKRIRTHLRDLQPLKDSINHLGLLHPILIDPDYNLISGARRLEAVKQLGWELIDVRLLDIKDQKTKLLIELEENVTRVNFSEEEISLAKQLLDVYSSNSFIKKSIRWFKDKFSFKKNT
jgi:ParB family transcriptional regulator, chromosome partitioning protein